MPQLNTRCISLGHFPAVAVQLGRQAGLQDARHVVQQAAAGDVGQAFDVGAVLGQRGQHLLDVDARGRHHDVDQRLAVEVVGGLGVGALQDLAHQRITVGMRAAGGQAQHDVARRDGLAGDERGLFHRTHRKTGQVVFAVRPASVQQLAMPPATAAAVSMSSLPVAK
ncbi:hypothetical protein G6F55_013817 [Rhizopus delemar]|nr:hypothetical protein G6F55_013817 [Rhizopus delemar]